MRNVLWSYSVSLLLLMPIDGPAAVLFQTGFEPSDYTLGILAGQNGWVQDIGPNNLIQVQNSVVFEGLQTLGFASTLGLPIYTRAGRGGINYDTAGADPIVTVNMTARFSIAGTVTHWRPIAGFDGVQFIGGIDVLPNSEVRVVGQDVMNTGVILSSLNWYRISAAYDFSSRTLTALLNGLVIGSVPFAGFSGSTVFAGFTIENVVSGTTSSFYDNILVATQSAVPEPASLSLIVLGGVLLGIGRRHLTFRR